QGFDVINMSLSTTKSRFAGVLHEVADAAYFRRTVLVASAHNMPVESYPWRFSSVISVGSHEEPDPLTYYYNPNPPVEFFARGVDVEGAWLGGASARGGRPRRRNTPRCPPLRRKDPPPRPPREGGGGGRRGPAPGRPPGG